MYLLLWKIGRMQGIFLSIERVFNKDQAHLVMATGSLTFFGNSI